MIFVSSVYGSALFGLSYLYSTMARHQIFGWIFLSVITTVWPSLGQGQEIPHIWSIERSVYGGEHQNWMIAEDRQGLLYVANSDGVLIFNGFDWQLVPLTGNGRARAVFLGQDGRVYASGFECFGYIDRGIPSRPVYVPIADSLLRGSNEEIWSIYGTDSTILFQSFAKVFLYDYDSIQSVDLPSNVVLGASVDQQFYVPKIRQGLYQLDRGQLVELAGSDQLPESSKISGILSGEQPRKLLIATQNHGLYTYSNGIYTAWNGELNDQLKSQQINRLTRLKDGGLAIGTISDGLYITPAGDRSSLMHLNKLNGLPNNTILSIFQAHDGNLWVGMDNGICRVDLADPSRHYYDRQGLLGTIFTSAVHKGRLYLGTNQGVYMRLDGGSFQLVPGTQGQVWSMVSLENQLLCGHNDGTFSIEGDRATKISENAGGWWMDTLPDGRVLQSTYNGLILIDPANPNLQSEPLGRRAIRLLKFTRLGKTLYGLSSNYQMYRITLEDDFSCIVEEQQYPFSRKLSRDPSISFFNYQEGVGFRSGGELFLFEGDTIKPLMFDKAIKPTDYSDYSIQYSLASQFGWRANFPLSNHQFHFIEHKEAVILGSDEGYTVFPVRAITPRPIHARIDFVEAASKLVMWDSTGFVELKPDENNLLVQLCNHQPQPDIHLEYQLYPWSSTFYEVPDGGKLIFNALEAGSYTLRLRDRTGQQKSLIQFTIAPHWYDSWPGVVLAILGISGMLLLVHYRNRQDLVRQSENLQKEKERELEAARIKAKNEQLEQELLYKSKMLVNSAMTIAQKNKILLELKQKMKTERSDPPPTGGRNRGLLKLINRSLHSDQEWQLFEKNFAEVHENFLQTLKEQYPNITSGELRLAAYLRMDLSSKEIASILHISTRSVENKRYRLRKKMALESSQNLKDHLMRL